MKQVMMILVIFEPTQSLVGCCAHRLPPAFAQGIGPGPCHLQGLTHQGVFWELSPFDS